MRPLTLALIVLCAASDAHAVPVTGYAMGRVTENRSTTFPSFPRPYRFTPGEGVYLRFTYDLDPPQTTSTMRARIAVDLFTEHGFRLEFFSSPSSQSTGSEVGGVLRLDLASDPMSIDLGFTGSVGTIFYSRDLGSPSEGFRADVVRVADASDFPVPEPSTLALGAIGAGVLGVAGMRRRKAA